MLVRSVLGHACVDLDDSRLVLSWDAKSKHHHLVPMESTCSKPTSTWDASSWDADLLKSDVDVDLEPFLDFLRNDPGVYVTSSRDREVMISKMHEFEKSLARKRSKRISVSVDLEFNPF